MNTPTKHDLSDLKNYPRHHLYAAKDGINIFSRVNIKNGDVAIIHGKEYVLFGQDMAYKGHKSKYHPEDVTYYEFKVK